MTRIILSPPIAHLVASLYIPILECLTFTVSMADVLGKSLIPSQRSPARPVPTVSQVIVYRIYRRCRFPLNFFSAISHYIISIWSSSPFTCSWSRLSAIQAIHAVKSRGRSRQVNFSFDRSNTPPAPFLARKRSIDPSSFVPPRLCTSHMLDSVQAARRCHLRSQIPPPSSRPASPSTRVPAPCKPQHRSWPRWPFKWSLRLEM